MALPDEQTRHTLDNVYCRSACFFDYRSINEYFTWEIPIWLQSIIGTIVVTVLEFISGCALNIFLGLELGMTDYILINKKIKNPHSVLSECGFIML